MTDARAFDMLISIWSFCEPEDREAFVSYLHVAGFIPSSNPEQADVDRSAERASSAVEVGATNSPDGATKPSTETLSVLVAPATGAAEAGGSGQPEMIPALTGQFPGTNVSGPERAGVTAGETATSSRTMRMTPLEPRTAGGLKGFGFTVNFDEPNSAVPAVEQAVTAPQAPRPAVTADIPNPQPTSSPVIADKAGDIPPPVSPATNPKPHCLKLKDGHCRISSVTSALCSECNNARMKARAV